MHFGFSGPVVLKSFLWVIRPSQKKNALRSIHLCFNVRHGDVKLSKPAVGALAALAELSVLRHLILIIEFDVSSNYAVSNIKFLLDWKYDIMNGWLRRIRDCGELKAITGLQTFQLKVFGAGYAFRQLIDKFAIRPDADDGRFKITPFDPTYGTYDQNPKDVLLKKVQAVENSLRSVMCQTLGNGHLLQLPEGEQDMGNEST